MSSAFETGQSTPESTEDDSTGDHWHQSQGDEAHTEQSTADEAHSDGNARKQQLPMQKRRRVTRACDECRRKKIKCDGKQPCTHCTVYSYDCTYDQPSNRRRNPAPQYIEALEHRLQKAEALLKTVLPDVDLSTVEESQTDTTDGVIDSVAAAKFRANDDSATIGAEKDSLLESMVESTGQLDLDDQGKWDFHGHSSGMMFLSRIREQFGDIMPIPDMRTSGWLKPQLHNSSRSVSDSPMDSNLPNVAELPSKEVALELASNSLDYACSLLRFVHQPSFYRMLDRIYSVPPVEFGDEENRFLPLLYVVLALGCLFAPNEKSELEQGGYENAVNQGFKYFLACRHMIEITDCRDLISLQAVLFMVMFLQSSAKLSTCYSYIGIALRSALRMGLHRSINGKFNPIELETRKRMFWVIRKMDTYVAALLGLPKTLSDDDIDQDLPLEIDDEFITAQGITPMPPGRFSIYAAPNAHTKLVLILAKVIKYVYPIKGPTVSRERCHSSYVVSHAKIREIERDLHDWRENLPSELQPGSPVPPDVERVQQLLRMAYAHVQMLLYRPFLHYASHKFHSKKVDKRSYACAAACISVSRNIIHITSNMKSRGLLIGAYWLTMYTTFFAIISLVFYVLENRDDETSAACFKDASEGKDALASLARRSNAADRCMITLNTLFDQLPARLKRERSKPAAPKKKRSAPTAQPPSSKASESQPNMPVHNSTDHIKRANTFPVHLNPPSRQRASIPNDGTSHRRELLSTDSANRRSLHEFSSISSSPGSGTPDSNPGALPLSANFGLFQQPNFGNNGSGVPELGAMMFPSDDPFAYPNQPMTIFENHQSIDPAFGALLNQSPNGTLFKAEPNSNNSPQYDMEAQLFGPMPPYMMQGQQVSAGPAPNAAGLSMAGMNMNPDEMYQQNQSTGLSPGVNMEDIFSGEEWSNLLMEQNMRP